METGKCIRRLSLQHSNRNVILYPILPLVISRLLKSIACPPTAVDIWCVASSFLHHVSGRRHSLALRVESKLMQHYRSMTLLLVDYFYASPMTPLSDLQQSPQLEQLVRVKCFLLGRQRA